MDWSRNRILKMFCFVWFKYFHFQKQSIKFFVPYMAMLKLLGILHYEKCTWRWLSFQKNKLDDMLVMTLQDLWSLAFVNVKHLYLSVLCTTNHQFINLIWCYYRTYYIFIGNLFFNVQSLNIILKPSWDLPNMYISVLQSACHQPFPTFVDDSSCNFSFVGR